VLKLEFVIVNCFLLLLTNIGSRYIFIYYLLFISNEVRPIITQNTYRLQTCYNIFKYNYNIFSYNITWLKIKISKNSMHSWSYCARFTISHGRASANRAYLDIWVLYNTSFTWHVKTRVDRDNDARFYFRASMWTFRPF